MVLVTVCEGILVLSLRIPARCARDLGVDFRLTARPDAMEGVEGAAPCPVISAQARIFCYHHRPPLDIHTRPRK